MEVVKVAHFRSALLVGNGEIILKRDFSGYFVSQLMPKDTSLVQHLVMVSVRHFRRCALSKKNLADAVALAFERENASAIIKALEKEANVEVKAQVQ